MAEPTVVYRLAPHVLAELEKKLPPPLIDGKTTDLVAGQLLGIQLVLKMLREGYAA
jgi:hypothetical protein